MENTEYDTATIYGEIENWPTKTKMAQILRDAGLKVYVGRYSVRVENCERFSFEEYGGDLGDPVIDAEADTAEQMITDGRFVSEALSCAKIKHRFEICDANDTQIGYLHYNWPKDVSDKK